MIKRLVWLGVGFVLGLGSSWTVTRRIRRLARRYVPAEVADRWGATMRAVVTEGRAAARQREAELRSAFGRGAGK